MRRLAAAMTMMVVAQAAQAADVAEWMNAPLRGSVREVVGPRRWSGFYAGGQVGFSAASMDFSRATSSMTSFLLRNSVLQAPVSNWDLLGKNNVQGGGFGGFVGYNYQWDDVTLGWEVNYNHLSGFESASKNAMSRSLVNPAGSTPPAGHTYTYNVTSAGEAALRIHDYMTFRARGGWTTGNWMPYMFGGLAVGRMDSARSVSITGTLVDDYMVNIAVGAPPVIVQVPQQDVYALTPVGQIESRTNNFVVGYTAGFGAEYALFGNVFARGEYEYVKFQPVKNISASINTIRTGVGVRF